VTALYPIEIGDQIETYQIVGSYPGGGYRAIDVTDHTRVHLEIGVANNWRTRVLQLLRTSSIAGSLGHPGVARIHGRGVLPDRRPWVASELAEGVPLCEVFARRLLAVDEAVALVRDLADIAAHAHVHHVVHGAIDPRVVLLCTGDRRSPIQLRGWSELRSPGIVDVAPPFTAFTAPELAHGPIDGKVDVFSIGAIAYRGLTGRFPGAITPELVAGVPGVVGALVISMLAHDPAQRPTALQVVATASKLCDHAPSPRFARRRWTPAPVSALDCAADALDELSARRLEV
jgi:eukaryotic-like serine/threonine-protein kinase